jgi:hypothetical protein
VSSFLHSNVVTVAKEILQGSFFSAGVFCYKMGPGLQDDDFLAYSYAKY